MTPRTVNVILKGFVVLCAFCVLLQTLVKAAPEASSEIVKEEPALKAPPEQKPLLTKKEMERLHTAAQKAAKFSYSPYSHFPVGAAVLTESGEVFLGTNVENASYGLTICAERVAIFNAITNGHKKIKALALFAEKAEGITPCGACRQVILEFGKDILVIYKKDRKLIACPVTDLIPDSFSDEDL